MIAIAALLAAMATASVPEVHAVAFTTIDHRPALGVLVSEDTPPVEFARQDDELRIRISGVAPADLRLPALERPVEGLRVEREEGVTVVSVTVAAEVPVETRGEPGILTVIFGPRGDGGGYPIPARLALSVPEVRAVAFTTIDHRPALGVLVSEDMPPAEFARTDDELRIRIPGVAPADLRLPALQRPVEGLRVEREEGVTVVSVTVAAEVPVETRGEPGILAVTFGERVSPEPLRLTMYPAPAGAAVPAAVALLVAKAAAPVPEVHAVRFTIIDYRAALRVLVSEDMPPAEVVREGEEVLVRLPGVAPEGLPLPEIERPLEGLGVDREAGATVLRVKVPPEVPYEASFEPGMVTVVFGEQPSPELRGTVTPELYAELFPIAGLEGEEEEDEEDDTFLEDQEGLYVGRIHLQPYLSVSYVDADIVAFNNPEPLRARYLEVVPGVTATSPIFTGRFALEVEPRFRFLSDIPEVNQTAWFAGARYDMPLGARTLLRIGHRYTRAILETTVVDPGREYFFGLAPFTFNETTAAARVTVGPNLTAEIDGGWRWSRFDQQEFVGFFDYDAFTLRAGLGYDLRSDLRAIVSYTFDRIPQPSDRPLAESTAHSLLGTLSGQITAFTSGSATVGLRRQDYPMATESSSTFTGVTLGGSLRRQLGHSSSVGVQFMRTPTPSGFDQNAYYVNNSVFASLDVGVPLQVWARGSVGYLRNSYPAVDPRIGEPRQDDIWAWTLGLGRQIGVKAWIRADYRREKRDSNIPGFDVTNDGFLIQLGIGRLGPGILGR